MVLELIPKSELPEWSEEDEILRVDFEKRMREGRLHIVSSINYTLSNKGEVND